MHQAQFQQLIRQEPGLAARLHNAQFDTPVSSISGYSTNVTTLHGNGFALLGNAGEFLDPIFSSGITIAMKSACLAAEVLDRQLRQQSVNWQTEFVEPLQKGVDTFRTFVTSWYEGGFQDVVFYQQQMKEGERTRHVTSMICSILAGYVWDENNPYVKNPPLRLNTLINLCREPCEAPIVPQSIQK